MTGVKQRMVILMALGILFVAILVLFDFLVLDPGGSGFTGEANAKCAQHGGVRNMNAQQGWVVCNDGKAF